MHILNYNKEIELMGRSRQNNNDGSELHRLKTMGEYDKDCWDRMYKISKPVIRNLVRQIDYKRFRVTPDIIASYFWDKMLYVFNKYYGTCEEEHLKARILGSLSTFKCHLLKAAYGERAEHNQSIYQIEDIFNGVEFEDDSVSAKAKSEMLDMMYKYMRANLNDDAYLVFEVLMAPPPYIKERCKESNRITNLLLIDFFELPKNRTSMKYLSGLREDIEYWENKAKEELHY